MRTLSVVSDLHDRFDHSGRVSLAPLADLRLRASLTIKEAMRLTGLSRHKVNFHIEEGHWRWFPEGARIRVITDSIFAYQDKLSSSVMGERR